MKRILVLSHSPYIGGAELALKGLVDPLADKFSWTVVVSSNVHIDKRVQSSGAQYRYLPLPWWCHEAHDIAAPVNQRSFTKSIKTLRQLAAKADILVTNTITVPWLGFIAQELDKPHIWYVHEYGDLDHNLQFEAGYDRSLRMISNCSSRILTISNAVKSHLSRIIPGEKIDIIHQAIDTSKLVSLPLPKSPYHKLLCLGAIKPSKGQHVALEAAIELDGAYSLDIIGPSADNAYLEDLQRLAAGHEHITVQPRAYSPTEELASHDTLLMCSENEALGRVTLEGLAAGRLVIGYGCLSTTELLSSGRGVIYLENNPSTLAEAIRSGTMKTIPTTGNRAFATKTYGPTQQSHDFESCVHQALNSPALEGNSLDEYLPFIKWQNNRDIKGTIRRVVPPVARRAGKRLLRHSVN